MPKSRADRKWATPKVVAALCLVGLAGAIAYVLVDSRKLATTRLITRPEAKLVFRKIKFRRSEIWQLSIYEIRLPRDQVLPMMKAELNSWYVWPQPGGAFFRNNNEPDLSIDIEVSTGRMAWVPQHKVRSNYDDPDNLGDGRDWTVLEITTRMQGWKKFQRAALSSVGQRTNMPGHVLVRVRPLSKATVGATSSRTRYAVETPYP